MKENDGRSQKSVFMIGVLSLGVLMAIWKASGSLLAPAGTTSTRKTDSTNNDVIGPPPENRLNDDGFRMCLLNDQVDGVVLGQEPLQMANIPLPIRFQCAGPSYDQFADKLEALVRQKAKDNPKWGHQPQPIPSRRKDSQGNYPIRRVLFFGSSHFRQVLTALLCQYSDQVLKTTKIHNTGKWSLNSFSLHVTLKQNIHLYLVINPPFIHHPEWERLLEQYVLQMPLSIMDLIVVSKFHAYQESRHSQPLLEFLMDHEGAAENVKVNVDPPSFVNMVNLYKGPLVYVSLFAKYGTKSYGNVVEAIEHLERGLEPPELPNGGTVNVEWEFAKTAQNQVGTISKEAEKMFTYKPPPPKIRPGGRRRNLADSGSITTRTNLLAVDGRRYTSELGECSTDTFKSVSTCITDPENPYYEEGHRCFGSRGGHPDLIVYDLVEAIYQLLKKG